jgi:hypothetical protein
MPQFGLHLFAFTITVPQDPAAPDIGKAPPENGRKPAFIQKVHNFEDENLQAKVDCAS